MYFKLLRTPHQRLRLNPNNFYLLMNWTTTLILVSVLHVSAAGYSQESISISEKKAPIQKIFKEITAQSGYGFLYDQALFKNVLPIDIELGDATLGEALQVCFKNLPLTYQIVGKIVVVRQKDPVLLKDSTFLPDLKGVVLTENGDPIPNATVSVIGTNKIVVTDQKGGFIITGAGANIRLRISSIGYITTEIFIKADVFINIRLNISVSKLDETVVIGYGTTTNRLNTGSVSRVTSTDISKEPVANPLEALVGHVPGLVVTQNNGNAGSGFTVQMRGINSIAQGTSPLFIIDGLPYPNTISTQIQIGNGGQSTFSSIIPSDIESIEILKDADATAIYGSRGANGVILITTKKGKPGKIKLDINLGSGLSLVSRKLNLLHTPQYLAMRHEAFQNDGISPDAGNAPDLVIWDTTRYTDWQKYFIGKSSAYSNLNATLSGGNVQTQFLFGGGYFSQGTVTPGNFGEKRGSIHLNITHASINKKFQMSYTTSYSNDRNRLGSFDAAFSNYIELPPDFPALYDNTGHLRWMDNGVSFSNPAGDLLKTAVAVTDNLINNLSLNYRIAPKLTLLINSGYTLIQLNQQNQIPIASQDPSTNPTGSSVFGTSTTKNWIVEPQLKFNSKAGKGKIEVLAGYTIERNIIAQNTITALGFTSDAVLNAAVFAPSVTAVTGFTDYRYQAVFGRVNYAWASKYLINLTGRRDGSTRFAPGKQYANFGAVGGAWIFSQEKLFREHNGFLSFGKLRLSYGLTGNDQIGDYQFLDNYGSGGIVYQGITATGPARLYNPSYAWETNKKFETGLDLGFLKDKVLLTVNYFRNVSGNQLINYQLPSQTGFSGILENFNAKVQNTGFEFQLTSTNISRKDFVWTTDFNFSITRNKLLSFPGIQSSSYSNTYVVGKPLHIQKLFIADGVDPQTGLYKVNGTDPSDQNYVLDLTPAFYGGMGNTLRYKGFELSFLLQFTKQKGNSYLYPTYFSAPMPGTLNNQPGEVLGRWRMPRDQTNIQKFTTGPGKPAFDNYIESSANVSDASFIRLKNAVLYYNLPASFIKNTKMQGGKFYIQVQNLFTITNYKGLEPEAQGLSGNLPLLLTVAAGIQLTF
jgi:TonB-linked SusC/RagA family outer membrane protein